jgi:hypothetical protein
MCQYLTDESGKTLAIIIGLVAAVAIVIVFLAFIRRAGGVGGKLNPDSLVTSHSYFTDPLTNHCWCHGIHSCVCTFFYLNGVYADKS